MQRLQGSRDAKLLAAVARAEEDMQMELTQKTLLEQQLVDAQATADSHAAKLRQCKEEAQVERTNRELIESQLAEVHALQMELRSAVAQAEEQAEEDRGGREFAEAQLGEAHMAKDQLCLVVQRAEQQAVEERQRREDLEQRLLTLQKTGDGKSIETFMSSTIARARALADCERQQREAVEQQLHALQRAEDSRKAGLSSEVADAERSLERERSQRAQLESELMEALATHKQRAEELRMAAQRAEEQANREMQGRLSIEEQLRSLQAEEEQRSASLSLMLDTLAVEVEASRAEVAAIRAVPVSSSLTAQSAGSAFGNELMPWSQGEASLSSESGVEALRLALAQSLSQLQGKHEKLEREKAKKRELKHELMRWKEVAGQAKDELAMAELELDEMTQEASEPPQIPSLPAVAPNQGHSDAEVSHMMSELTASTDIFALAAAKLAESESQQAALLKQLALSSATLSETHESTSAVCENAAAMAERLDQLAKEREGLARQVASLQADLRDYALKQNGMSALQAEVETLRADQRQNSAADTHCAASLVASTQAEADLLAQRERGWLAERAQWQQEREHFKAELDKSNRESERLQSELSGAATLAADLATASSNQSNSGSQIVEMIDTVLERVVEVERKTAGGAEESKLMLPSMLVALSDEREAAAATVETLKLQTEQIRMEREELECVLFICAHLAALAWDIVVTRWHSAMLSLTTCLFHRKAHQQAEQQHTEELEAMK